MRAVCFVAGVAVGVLAAIVWAGHTMLTALHGDIDYPL
jgi:hypothetical protein